MQHPFNNQVALITGAGSGIGRQFAFELAGQGAVIAAVDLRAEPLENLLTELKARNYAGGWEIADVTDRIALQAAVTSLTRRLGPIELLIANAGIGLENPAVPFRAEDFGKQIQVNLQGVANSIEAVLPGMVERRRGQLVAISSVGAYRGLPLMAGYCAAKAGVVALMDSLRVELRRYNVYCTTICPSFVRTPMTERMARMVKGRLPGVLEVDDAVRRMVRAISKRKPFYAFPWLSWLQMALMRALPTRIGDWIVGKLARRMLRDG